ncbi:MAG TPA: hypothetical protein VFA35_01925 [Burkholderiaceae bacterium]|nr:hypothetical protein [Burkholderiaceae bacterium]
MHPATIVGCGIALAALSLVFAAPPAASTAASPTASAAPSTAGPPPQAPLVQDPAALGHLALIVEGNVGLLAITHAVAKTDPWGGVPTGLKSNFELRLLGDDGVELLKVPVDLSPFETDPARIGGPVEVTGCQVRSSAIALIVNVPRLAGVRSYQFTRRGAPIGSTGAQRVAELLEERR